jgi:hypothetical protein
MTDTIFQSPAVEGFRAAYPCKPARLSHGLVGHPLLNLESLAELAERLGPDNVEYNAADLPIAVPQEDLPANGLSALETIRSIEENASWMVLRQVQTDPVYGALLRAALAEMRPIVEKATGEMLKLEGFIFISSPNAVTPLHFDPEYNILLQIRGSKEMTIFPAEDAEILTHRFQEQYHVGGPRNLPWRDEFAARGCTHHLTPGDALYVPVTSPHWVKNGPEVSISFSVTWRSNWSFNQAGAHALNGRLRRLGLNPKPPKHFPESNLLKCLTYRALSRADRIARTIRR